MEMLSNQYGWTPTQIRDQRVEDLENYIEIISTRNILEKNNSKKYGR